MIPWRSSRLLLFLFILLVTVVGFLAFSLFQEVGLAIWRDPRTAFSSRVSPTPTTFVPSGTGQPVELPRYPAVTIDQPVTSVFDPVVSIAPPPNDTAYPIVPRSPVVDRERFIPSGFDPRA